MFASLTPTMYLMIFLVSGAVLSLEIALTRLFSIYLSYHFAFMVISVAMLGIGSAGTVLSLLSIRKKRDKDSLSCDGVDARLAAYALMAGISVIVGYVFSNNISFDPVKLSWDRLQIFYVALYCLALSVPFFFAGMLIATAFSTRSEKSEIIYGADLLGAGTGSLAVLFILNTTGPEYAVLTASMLCFLAAFTAGGKVQRSAVLLLLILNTVLMITHPNFMSVKLSPYKDLSLALKHPGAEHLGTYYNSFSRIDTLKSPAVRFAPGLSLTYLDPLPEQTGISIDGGGMNAVTKADTEGALRFLEYLPAALVYELKTHRMKTGTPGVMEERHEKTDVLVLEPKGGLHVMLAGHYPLTRTRKIESNPLIVEILHDDYSGFSGGIFEHDTWSGLGRGVMRSPDFTERGSLSLDIIDIPMTGVSPSGAFGIAEDYRFTVEAFTEYLGALKRDGVMSISMYIIPPPRIELRMMSTVIEALERSGASEPSRHIAVIRSWDSINMLVKKSPLGQEEIGLIRTFARDRRFDFLHYPGMREEEANIYVRMKTNDYFDAFQSLLDSDRRDRFTEDYLFHIKPVYDESPFFNYYLRLDNIKAIYEVMGRKWHYFIEEGYLLPVIFLQVLILSLVLILLPVLIAPWQKGIVKEGKKKLLPTLLYFAMLGLGFMFVEVTLIQKSILPLVNPSYAVAVVLTSILISSGLGSMMSSRFSLLRTSIVLPLLVVFTVIYSLLFPVLLDLISPYTITFKVMMVFFILLPIGLLMGIPFPAGIRILGERDDMLIPWAWAVNGCVSVIAPILTIMIAMSSGFKTVLWLGAAAYLTAYAALRRLIKNS
jgi:hypothetical protein